MKNLLVFMLGLITLTSCEDTVLTEQPMEKTSALNIMPQEGMERIVVNTTDEIAGLIQQLGEPDSPQSRSAETIDATFSNNEEEFISLLEADKRRVMASLTPEQRAEVEKEGLEYEPCDSVIADAQFAMLLNAEREIQVGNTIYKYYPNGVACVNEQYHAELKPLNDKIATLVVTPDNIGQTVPVDNHTTFTFMNYAEHTDICEDITIHGEGGSSSTGSGQTGGNSANPLILKDGRSIPGNLVRDINYNGPNDGGWLQQLISGMFGKNVVAINHFTSNKKLTMHFYDQNYLIYSNIGTKLKMQQKKFLIWWNVRADEMVQGWETVTIQYELPRPIPPTTFTHPDFNNPTVTAWCPFPFKDERTLLFHIPYIDYDFTTKDLNRAFKAAATKVFNAASAWSKLSVQSPEDIGLMCENNNYAYIMHGPNEKSASNVKSVESKFYAKWFPGRYELQFSFGSSVKLKGIVFDPNDNVKLYRGSVYGAILYNGQWRAARIVKDN